MHFEDTHQTMQGGEDTRTHTMKQQATTVDGAWKDKLEYFLKKDPLENVKSFKELMEACPPNVPTQPVVGTIVAYAADGLHMNDPDFNLGPFLSFLEKRQDSDDKLSSCHHYLHSLFWLVVLACMHIQSRDEYLERLSKLWPKSNESWPASLETSLRSAMGDSNVHGKMQRGDRAFHRAVKYMMKKAYAEGRMTIHDVLSYTASADCNGPFLGVLVSCLPLKAFDAINPSDVASSLERKDVT